MTNFLSSIHLIGVPTDIGASQRGATMGPEALRVAGIDDLLRVNGFTVQDCGDVHGPRNPWQPPVDGYRHLKEVVSWNQLLFEAVYRSLNEGAFPIVMGGDHCLGVGSVAAVAKYCRDKKKKLRILWLDAHADFNLRSTTPTGNMHGMPVSILCGLGPKELTHLTGVCPAIDPSEIVQIGIRSVDEGEKLLLHEKKVAIYDMRFIDEYGMRVAMERALAGLDENTHLHVSFDVDFLDPVIAPGVGTTVPGGPNYREAQLCMEMIADTGRMASLDIVGLNPALDNHNATAKLTLLLVESLFGKSTLLRL